jgi:hypothetical protein
VGESAGNSFIATAPVAPPPKAARPGDRVGATPGEGLPQRLGDDADQQRDADDGPAAAEQPGEGGRGEAHADHHQPGRIAARRVLDAVELRLDFRDAGAGGAGADALDGDQRSHVDREPGNRPPDLGAEAGRILQRQQQAFRMDQQMRLEAEAPREARHRILHMRRVGAVEQHEPPQPQREMRHVMDRRRGCGHQAPARPLPTMSMGLTVLSNSASSTLPEASAACFSVRFRAMASSAICAAFW